MEISKGITLNITLPNKKSSISPDKDPKGLSSEESPCSTGPLPVTFSPSLPDPIVIPPNYHDMIPILFTTDHRAILYLGQWNQVVPHVTDLAVLISRMSLIQNPKLQIFGKEAVSHRSVGFFSDQSEGYRFSGQIMKSQPLFPELKQIIDKINQIFSTEQVQIPNDIDRKFLWPPGVHRNFNGILVNYYADGSEYISAHSDDEKELSPSGVFALSMGSIRDFQILAKQQGQTYCYLDPVTNQWCINASQKKDQVIYTLATYDHSVMLMHGPQFQKVFKHAVPVSKIPVGPRISWTWRSHLK